MIDCTVHDTRAPARRDPEALFSPASVAVVGASDDPMKWGNWLARAALRDAHRRAVYLVNRRGGDVLGEVAHTSLAALPEAPELVVLVVPGATLEAAVAGAIAAGARAIVAISAGAGNAGGTEDAALARRARGAGVVLVGPNCLGVSDAGTELELVPNPLPAGQIGLLSQSGNLALEAGILAAEVGLGFSRFVSLGNQVDTEAAELVRALAAHAETRVIALYLEDFRDGRAFAQAAADAAAAGKPVVLLTVAHTAATARGARSHTGALASDGAAIDAACRAAGIERVSSIDELVDVCQALARASVPRGRRVAVLSDGGGHGGIAAGLAHEAGLELPDLGDGVGAQLRAALPPGASCVNPIDLAGAAERDLRVFDRVAAELLASGEVDAVIVTGYFGGYGEYDEAVVQAEAQVAERLAAVAARGGGPVVVQTMYPGAVAAGVLRRDGVPVYRSLGRAVGVLGRLARRRGAAEGSIPTLPEPRAPLGDSGYEAVRALLVDGGIPFHAGRAVATAAELSAAAAEIGYPVVLKAIGLLHKSDAGGVVLDLRDEAGLTRAVAHLRARMAPAALWVERMADGGAGIELLAGVRWDARFGPILLVGFGGIYAEALGDIAVALAPATPTEVERLLLSLRAAPILRGARGRPATDLAAAAEAIAALSRVAAAHPEIAEIEVNPLLVTPAGALGLDARAVLAA
jgi:acetate---CoA ligase (ADP-forming)